MSYELYRQTKIGESLVEALDELVSEEKLPPDMAMKVLEQFDKVCILVARLLFFSHVRRLGGHSLENVARLPVRRTRRADSSAWTRTLA